MGQLQNRPAAPLTKDEAWDAFEAEAVALYGLRQALDGADQAYAAAIGAVKAYVHLVQERESLSYKPPRSTFR